MLPARRFAILYLVLATAFVAQVARRYDSVTGFSSLVCFGDAFASRRIPQLRDAPLRTFPGVGYDGQFYAQIAVSGDPLAPELAVPPRGRTALDAAAYRERRILLPLAAHVAGLGRPSWVLTAYALANPVCWLVTAWLLARWWFPPGTLHDLVRWAGVLLGVGTLVSVSFALTDLPALLLLALAMRALERERPWLGAVLLGAAGLTRETSVLAAGAWLPGARYGESDASPATASDARVAAWTRGFACLAVAVAPVAVWTAILSLRFGAAPRGPLSMPLAAPAAALASVLAGLPGSVSFGAKLASAIVPLVAQSGLLAARPALAHPWWRAGVPFVALACVLGPDVWAGPIMAVPRTVLPLLLAFNVLAPRTRAGLALLLVGNLGVLTSPWVLAAWHSVGR